MATTTDALYDPYNYEINPSDILRQKKLLKILPKLPYKRTLDLGCGNAFMTQILPGEKIIGIDPDAPSIAAAQKRALGDRFEFFVSSIYDIHAADFGTFDLIVITGVLYTHFVGKGFSIITRLIDAMLNNDGVLAVCNISKHPTTSFNYTPIAMTITYRKFRTYKKWK